MHSEHEARGVVDLVGHAKVGRGEGAFRALPAKNVVVGSRSAGDGHRHVIAQIVCGEAAVDRAAREGIAHVHVGRELSVVARVVEGQLGLGGPRPAQLLLVARGQAQVDSQGEAASRLGQEVVLAPNNHVADPARAARLLGHPLVGARAPEGMDRRVGRRGETDEGGVDRRVHVDAHDRHRDPEVEAVGDAVVREEGDRVGLRLQGEVRAHEVAFEEGVLVLRTRGGRGDSRPRRPVGGLQRAAVVVLQVEAHPPAEALAFEAVELHVLEVEPGRETSLPVRERALREGRAEVVAVAVRDAGLRVGRVGEAARGRAEGEGGELGHERAVEGVGCGELRRSGKEVRLVGVPRHGADGGGHGHRLGQEPRQELRQRALGGGRAGQGEGAHEDAGDARKRHDVAPSLIAEVRADSSREDADPKAAFPSPRRRHSMGK